MVVKMINSDLLHAKQNTTMNIAFTLIGSKTWMGGFNYLLNLLTCLSRFESERIRPFIFCGDDASNSDVAAFEAISGVVIIRSQIFNVKNRRKALLRTLLIGKDLAAMSCFDHHRIDIVFESDTFYGWRFTLPVLAWFPDLQHKLMPDLFSKVGWWRREIGFRFQIASGRKILLSSETARNDCEYFYPKTSLRTKILRFPAHIVAADLLSNPHELLNTYSLPPIFIFLPNQFWKHKNHAVVIEAVGKLHKKGCSVTVVATGNSRDPRHPKLYEELEQRIRALGVSSNFRMLGVVPRSHLIALLRTCSVLINPSLFEGWSTTVEEGKAFGIPMILSDLPVHREQAEDRAIYFPVDNALMLADHLENYVASVVETPRGIQVDNDAILADFASNFTTLALQSME